MQAKLLALVVEHIDRARVSARELHGLGDDGRQHRFEVERRVHRLADLAQRLKLSDRARQFVCARTQLVEQSRIFDCNDGLGGKVLH
jgi:hypothetical protein